MRMSWTHGIRILAATATAAGVVALSACGMLPTHDTPAEPAEAIPQAVPPPPPAPGTIYQPGNSVSFFQDPKAHRVGDILTIILEESTQGQAASSTATGKKDSIGIGTPSILGHSMGRLGASADTSNSFAGTGTSQQSNTLTGEISVRVVRRLPNGVLQISGTKHLQINQSDEELTLSGYVREQDIGPDNTVPSDAIALSNIRYTGRGALNDANEEGWLARFFNSKLWPF
ncbi:MAG: flagellar basal body L-ring protein FlgH [Rhodanobacteraceae bacterium]